MYIVDRRLNPNSKSLENRQRFLRRAKEQLQDAVRHASRGTAPREFLRQVQERSAAEGGYVTIVEVCGFNDWLLELLPLCGCRETVLVQADRRCKRKTDRRDAHKLGELLWVNHHRLAAGQPISHLRRVRILARPERVSVKPWIARPRREAYLPVRAPVSSPTV